MSKKSAKKWGKRESKDLIDLMDKVSNDLSVNFEPMNQDAEKILKDAHERAQVADKNKT